MEAICFSETWVDFRLTWRPYIPEDSGLHNHSGEKLKSCVVLGIMFYRDNNFVIIGISLILAS
jgi:hypothetical protein